MIFDYFLLDSVNRNLVVEGNNNLVKRCDALWVFGPVSDGVLAEVLIARELGKKIKYFKIAKPHKIVPVGIEEVVMENEVLDHKTLLYQ